MSGRVLLRVATLALLLAPYALPPSAYAKGSFDKILVYGEGEALEVTDPLLLPFDAFNDFSAPYPGTPSITTPGLFIVRGANDTHTGDFTPIDSLRFFPHSQSASDQPFVYYEGLVNGWSEYDAKWYFAKPIAAEALAQALDAPSPYPLTSIPPTFLVLLGTGAGAVLVYMGRKVIRTKAPANP